MKTLHLFILTLALFCSYTFALPSIGSVVVGNTETQLLAAEAARTSFVVSNPASNSNTIYIKYDSSATAVTTSNGIPLPPGSSFSYTATGAANSARNRITAIAASNTTVNVSSDNAR